MNSIEFKISHDTCARLMDYSREYAQLGYQNFYGLADRPRYREGGGCSAFGTSFLDVAGILDSEFENNWTRDIQVQNRFIGGKENGGKKVPLRYLMSRASHGEHWAVPPEPSREIFFWDPDKIYRWIETQYQSPMPWGNPVAKTKNHKSLGLVYDRTAIPTPSDSFWRSNP